MANYYTEAAFQIPCTLDQAESAVKALKHIDEDFSELAEKAIAKGDADQLTVEEQFIRHCFYHHPEQNQDGSERALEWNFTTEYNGDGLFVSSFETINTHHAAVFTQALLKAFDLPSMVVIEASHTCDKNRVGAFGGHAAVVTKDFIRWDTMPDWISAEIQAHETKTRHYACRVTRQFGEHELDYSFLMSCDKDQDPESRITEIVLSLEEGGESSGKGYLRSGR